MIVRTTLLFLGLASLVSSYCMCSQSYSKYYPTFSIQSAYDNVTYDNCVPDVTKECTVVINQNDASKGVGGFEITEFTVANGKPFTIVIKDGDATPFTLTQNNYASEQARLKGYASLNPSVTIILQYNDANGVTFNMYAYPKDLGTTAAALTTAAPPTTDGPAGYLGVDLAFAFDSTGSDQSVFGTMRNVIKDAVNSLTVIEDVTQPYGARLSIQSISSATQPNNMVVPWAVTKQEFLTSLNAIPTRNPVSNYAPPLAAFLDDHGYFTTKTTDGANSRTNVQRIYAIFTQNEPNDLDALKLLLPKLVDRDVHLVVHWFGASATPVFLELSQNFTNFAFLPYDAANATKFYNNYILNGDDDSSFGCANGKIARMDVSKSATWPPNYAPGTSNYCNNQNLRLDITAVNADTTALCFTVANYQLEIEKDYARFYDVLGTEVASLTGNNVVGAKFQVNGTSATVRFTTNEYLVYSGIKFGVSEINPTASSCV